MEKNFYLLINDIIYQLYTENSLSSLKNSFLKRLNLIIPYSYASILSAKETSEGICLTAPVTIPASFERAEQEYIQLKGIDHTDWILYSSETVLIRESDIMSDTSRLASPIYQKCYRNYHIFDTLQMSIVYKQKIYAILTLYRTKSDGPFSDEEMFYLRSLSKHLNFLFYTHSNQGQIHSNDEHLKNLKSRYQLTTRENEILGYILDCMGNEEILQKIPITEHTLQKHIQNIYRKCCVSTRWELLKL